MSAFKFFGKPKRQEQPAPDQKKNEPPQVEEIYQPEEKTTSERLSPREQIILTFMEEKITASARVIFDYLKKNDSLDEIHSYWSDAAFENILEPFSYDPGIVDLIEERMHDFIRQEKANEFATELAEMVWYGRVPDFTDRSPIPSYLDAPFEKKLREDVRKDKEAAAKVLISQLSDLFEKNRKRNQGFGEATPENMAATNQIMRQMAEHGFFNDRTDNYSDLILTPEDFKLFWEEALIRHAKEESAYEYRHGRG